MTFKEHAHEHLISPKVGFKQGATKTTVDTYKKGKTEIIINNSSFAHRKVAKDNSFSEAIFKDADLELLKLVLSPQRTNVFFSKR